MDDDVEALLRRHAGALGDEEVIALRSAVRVTRPRSPVRCESLLGIYFFRAKMLRRFSSPHAERLRRDVEALCVELARSYDGECVMWDFHLDAHNVVLVEHVNGDLLGVLHTIGRGQVRTNEEWIELWGPEDGAKVPD
ncbi:MAG: hypothetical protein ACXVEF_20200 [Polyangiales bacterium]